MKTETFVDMYYPRSMYDESESRLIENGERDIEKWIDELPEYCHCFQFRDVITQTATREDGTTFQDVQSVNLSPKYYPGGRLVDENDIRMLEPKKDYEILLTNMKDNGWGKVMLSRRGRFNVIGKEGSIPVRNTGEK